MPTVILLSATAGYGHTRSAEALRVSLAERLPGWAVRHEDIGIFTGPFLRLMIEKGWKCASTFSGIRVIYSFLHKKVITNDWLAARIAKIWDSPARRISSFFCGEDIRAVVALHPGAGAVAANWRQEQKFLCVVVATDLVVHAFHALDNIDVVYADRSAVLASKLIKEHASRGKVRFLGLPVAREFLVDERKNTSSAARCLITFGAFGMRAHRSLSLIREIIKLFPNIHFIFACGTNRALRAILIEFVRENVHIASRVEIIDFQENFVNIMKSVDMVIGKAGGLTVGESRALGLPLGFLDCLPGQEEWNIQVAISNGFGRIIASVDDFEFWIKDIATKKTENKILRMRFALGSLYGIEAIADDITKILLSGDKVRQSSSPVSSR